MGDTIALSEQMLSLNNNHYPMQLNLEVCRKMRFTEDALQS